MNISPIIVLVDRGGLKAYRVRGTPTRGSSLNLIQVFEIPNVNSLSRNRHTTAVNDWPQLKTEVTQRICKQLANEITRLIRDKSAEEWSFAAPESICNKILDYLAPAVRERMVDRVELDLIKTPAKKLPQYFRSLQPV